MAETPADEPGRTNWRKNVRGRQGTLRTLDYVREARRLHSLGLTYDQIAGRIGGTAPTVMYAIRFGVPENDPRPPGKPTRAVEDARRALASAIGYESAKARKARIREAMRKRQSLKDNSRSKSDA